MRPFKPCWPTRKRACEEYARFLGRQRACTPMHKSGDESSSARSVWDICSRGLVGELCRGTQRSLPSSPAETNIRCCQEGRVGTAAFVKSSLPGNSSQLLCTHPGTS